MASKVNPYTFRLGINKKWKAKWYARKSKYTEYLMKDEKLLSILKEKLKDMAVSSIETERTISGVNVIIYSAKPGLLIGKQGAGLEKLKSELSNALNEKININVFDTKNPDTDATIIANTVARQIEKRVHYKRAMKQAVSKAMEKGAFGIKVLISGRLGGNEIARSEWVMEGRIPLQTIRANIDFAISEAMTTTGKLGIKVWVFKGLIFEKKDNKSDYNENEYDINNNNKTNKKTIKN